MARPVTLFTGQWADLPSEEMARKTKEFGYDGIELACWGDHFEVDKALADDNYCTQKRELLEKVGGENAKAVQVGGASGHCIPAGDFDRAIAFEDLATGGSIIVRQRGGSGIIPDELGKHLVEGRHLTGRHTGGIVEIGAG